MVKEDQDDSQLVFEQLWEPVAGTEIPESLMVRPPPLMVTFRFWTLGLEIPKLASDHYLSAMTPDYTMKVNYR